ASINPGNGWASTARHSSIARSFSSGEITSPNSTVSAFWLKGKIRIAPSARALFRVKILSQPVSDKVERENRQRDRNTGKEKRMRVCREIVAGLFDHRPPAWCRRRNAQPQKRQRCFGQDRTRHSQRCLHDQRLDRIRKDVYEEDP